MLAVLSIATLAAGCVSSGGTKLLPVNLAPAPAECRALTDAEMRARQPSIPDDPDLAALSAEYIVFTAQLARERAICDRWRKARDAAYGGGK